MPDDEQLAEVKCLAEQLTANPIDDEGQKVLMKGGGEPSARDH